MELTIDFFGIFRIRNVKGINIISIDTTVINIYFTNYLLQINSRFMQSAALRHASSGRALSTKMNNDRGMAITIALLGFNDLGRSVTPYLLT